MKIAIPLSEGRVAELSDDCDRFTIVAVDLTENRILDSCRAEPDAEWLGRLAAWLAEQAVDLVIAVEVRPEMKTRLMESSIRIIVGAPNDSPHSVIKAYLAGGRDKPDTTSAVARVQ
jgi:predicted Fe-Mo cluster-binding NifX family protein